LHKALLEYQKRTYETTNGPVQNPNHYYQLVVSDESFAWLKTLSALVVSIDELLESKETKTEAEIDQIAQYTKNILTTTGGNGAFGTNYTEALKKDDAVAALHANVMKLISL
ncbi:MAG: hypothetical protein JNK33_04825, partial [Candidatus Doudnabacteria bacterium]|nr:hypothetical protein [Candidatus Doudnabacteria bacterium]